MMQVFDAASFWGSVSCLLLILLVGCPAELGQRITERLKRRERAFLGADSCMDSTTDKGAA